MDVAEWQARCPLVAWRRSSEATQSFVALSVGVSVNTLRSWEKGNSTPNIAHMTRLRRLMGVSGLARAWATWLEESGGIHGTRS